MKRNSIIVLALMIGVLTGAAKAQSVTPVDFMRNNPRNMFSNPACFTPEFGFFDLALGGIDFSLQNIGFKYDSFFRFNNAGKPVAVDLNQGVARLRDVNYLNSFVNYDIFNCGRRTKYGFFTYSHRFRLMESFSYNRDFFALLAEGNASFMGESNPANVDLKLSLKSYQEFNFGYQMCLTDKLNVGARVKFLMGLAHARSNNINFQLMTDPDTYALSMRGAFDLRATIPYDLVVENGAFNLKDSRFDVANLFKNYGAGLDLGAEYRINEKFGVAAAINDLGFIRWTNYASRYVANLIDAGSLYLDGALVFEGFTQAQIDGLMNDPDYFIQFVDTLSDYFYLNSESLGHYTTGLNTTLMARGYYDLTPQHRFSAQLLGYCSGIGFKPAFTLAYSGSFLDNYDVVATYTMMQGSYANFGLGLSANLDGFVIYAASNNLFGWINPANSKGVGFQFGMSFTGGERTTRSERILLKD